MIHERFGRNAATGGWPGSSRSLARTRCSPACLTLVFCNDDGDDGTEGKADG